MKSVTVGDLGRQCRLIDAVLVDASSPDVEATFTNEHPDGIGLQLVSGGSRFIDVLALDSVVASSHTWTFKGGHFTANDVGGTLTVAGAAQANNNAIVTIASVTSANIIVTGGTQTNETFVPSANLTAEVIQASPAGEWEFSISNTFCKGTGSEHPCDGSPWTPISDQFSPAIEDVSEQYVPDTANSANQYVQAYPLVARAGKIKFHRTGGAGPVSVFRFQKGNH